MNNADDMPVGYRLRGYAAIGLCRNYVKKYEGDFCVHCKWFEMMEPATVSTLAIGREHTKDDAVAEIQGECVRFPPKLFKFENDELLSEFPGVSGCNRCGEFSEQRRCAEEICLEDYCE